MYSIANAVLRKKAEIHKVKKKKNENAFLYEQNFQNLVF